MQRAYDLSEGFQVSEMAIVDTFTKLIFGEEDDFHARELLIIQAFRAVDENVLRDSHADMGEYLRNLGVREMIQVVARVREYMHTGAGAHSDIRSSDTIPACLGNRSTH
ncbi:MAG: hypothetical protein ACI9JM_003086 [Halioglobus sp.]|jgi:hypothetical protein